MQFDDRVVVYYIGTNALDNFAVIDKGAPDDYWFHAKDISSCHVVAKIAEGSELGLVDKHVLRSIIKRGALICKQNTSKLKSLQDVDFIYTQVKNITKLDKPGLVTVTNEKRITC